MCGRVCAQVPMNVPQRVCKVGEQLVGVGALALPCRSRDSNSRHQNFPARAPPFRKGIKGRRRFKPDHAGLSLLSFDLFSSAGSRFGLRWFTPESEFPLCGHATLASAAVLFHKRSNVHLAYLFLVICSFCDRVSFS